MTGQLTVIIPCKDERVNIANCIRSVRDVADEIIVADSGSTDGTLEIVKELDGCKLIEREYVHSGDFKNWAIPQAASEWVLIVDADERVTPEMTTEIRQTIASPQSQDGYVIFRTNYFMGHKIKNTNLGHDSVLRLFRRDLGRYFGETDHAEVQIETGRVGKLKNKFEHLSLRSYDQYLKKLNRYTYWDAHQNYQAGNKPKYFRMLLGGPLRFLQQYVVRWGFLDGLAGFQIAALTGYYTFLKQARLWEMHYGQAPPDIAAIDGDRDSSDPRSIVRMISY